METHTNTICWIGEASSLFFSIGKKATGVKNIKTLLDDGGTCFSAFKQIHKIIHDKGLTNKWMCACLCVSLLCRWQKFHSRRQLLAAAASASAVVFVVVADAVLLYCSVAVLSSRHIVIVGGVWWLVVFQ